MPDEETTEERRPRPFWSGTIAFGLVSLPVSLFVASRSARVSLRMVDEKGTPLSRRYFCPREERPLPPKEIVRGYAVDTERFVVVEDDELNALAPEQSQEIDLRRFVALDEIDPMYFERAYFLAPDKGAMKAYRLLARSMEDAGRAGIATFVMRGKAYLVAIIAEKGILRAETLRFHDELRSPADIGLSEPEKADTKRVREVQKSMESLATDTLDRRELSDRHSQRVLKRVREKLRAGEDVIEAPEAPEEEGAEVVDLMEVLKRSLRQAPAERKRPRQRQNGRAERSKAELYKRARELDIPGRGSMTKQQLVKAIHDAG